MRLLLCLSSVLMLAGACASGDDGADTVAEGVPFVEEAADSDGAVPGDSPVLDSEEEDGAEVLAAVDDDPLLVNCGDAIEAVVAQVDSSADDFSDQLSVVLADPSGPAAVNCEVLTDPVSSGLDEAEVYNYMLARFPIEVLAALAEVVERAPGGEFLE